MISKTIGYKFYVPPNWYVSYRIMGADGYYYVTDQRDWYEFY